MVGSLVMDVARAVSGRRYAFTSEAELQEGLALALEDLDQKVEREAIRGPDRFDFLVGTTPAVVVEVKIDGSLAALTRQVYRYAERPDVDAVVVVTPLARLARLPGFMAGKPIVCVHLLGSCL